MRDELKLGGFENLQGFEMLKFLTLKIKAK